MSVDHKLPSTHEILGREFRCRRRGQVMDPRVCSIYGLPTALDARLIITCLASSAHKMIVLLNLIGKLLLFVNSYLEINNYQRYNPLGRKKTANIYICIINMSILKFYVQNIFINTLKKNIILYKNK